RRLVSFCRPRAGHNGAISSSPSDSAHPNILSFVISSTVLGPAEFCERSVTAGRTTPVGFSRGISSWRRRMS
ncbi:MAG TPA: hypothetical protein QF882_00535, partial [Arenicellales bacterium]|nr:hypothetical protein [Arenicellales bacterium]